MDIKILVAAHKKYWMPQDSVYLPLHVGKSGKADIGFCGDNTGDNISEKNPGYCELTGLYWAWKNLDCDYLGLVHYRRHFTAKGRLSLWQHGRTDQGKKNCILTGDDLNRLLPKYKIIVPVKRNYYIETLYSHYAHTFSQKHLDITRKIISEKYPEYLRSFDRTMKNKSGYMFNMFIMEKKLLSQYCMWLFDILFELEKHIDTKALSAFQERLYGRVSEIIFNVWLDYQVSQHGYPVKELRWISMEEVNYFQKGRAFLKAKVFHKKYEKSF